MRVLNAQFVPVHVACMQAFFMLVPFVGHAHSYFFYILVHDLLTRQCHSPTAIETASFLVQAHT